MHLELLILIGAVVKLPEHPAAFGYCNRCIDEHCIGYLKQFAVIDEVVAPPGDHA
jgi:hypothetical protein